MKRRVCLFKSLMFILGIVFQGKIMAQYTISGSIVDLKHKKPIEYAIIQLMPSDKAIYSDSTGKYQFNGISKGEYTLYITALGYFTLQQKIFLQKDTILNLTLEENPALMQEVVISGTLYPVSKSDSPIPVEVYNKNFFQSNPTNTVFEAMQNVNGVRPQVNCNICNTGDIHINGLEGPYSMVLIDGMPIVSGLSTVYGLMGIPTALIEQVEVIKGANSTLYGSEAVAGTINIITKDVNKAPSLSVEAFSSDWLDLNVDIGLKNKLGKQIYNLLGVNYFNYSRTIDKNNDGFTDIPLQHRIALFNKIHFQDKQNDEVLNLVTRYVYEDRWGGQTHWKRIFRGTDSIYGESIYTHRAECFGTYYLPYLKNKVKLQFSTNYHHQNSVYGTVFFIAQQYTHFAQLLYQNRFNKHFLTIGTAYRHVFYDDNTFATQEYQNTLLQNKPSITSLPGIFIQDEFKVNNTQSLLAGFRYDYHNLHGSVVSPRIAYKYTSLNKKHILRANIGNGFRVVNVFTEDHAALTGARKVIFAHELKPETSWNMQINYLHKNYLRDKHYFTFDVTLFNTYFTNKIIPDYSDVNKVIYDNLKGYAISRGISANLNTVFESGFSTNLGFTLLDVYFVEDHQKQRQLLTEPYSGVWGLSYENKRYNLTLDYTGNLYGPMKLPLLGELDTRPEYSPVWTIQNIQISKKWTSIKGLELFGGIKNIFNFVSPAYSITRPHDPFDKNVVFDNQGNVVPTPENPQALTFDTSYVFASNQGRRAFLGIRYTL